MSRKEGRESHISRLVPYQYALFLLAPLLLWPALVNGGAFFFPDTPAYVRSIDALAVRALDRPSEWTSPRTLHVARAVSPVRATGAPRAPAIEHSPPILSGRSPFYGMLAYLGVAFGSFWVVLALQALAATGVVIGVMRHAVDPARARAFAIATIAAVAVTMLTPLPYFVSMLMPDVFAGLAIVAAAMLLGGWRRESTAGRVGWIAVAGYGALTHSATTLILLGIVALAALVWLVTRRRDPAGAALLAVALAVVTGLAGDHAVSIAIERTTGHPMIRPPFVTARLTADGLGTTYARQNCPAGGWVLCRYVDRLPLHSDSFLWSPDPRGGVFMTVSPAEQRALAAEQMPFALAVVRAMPLEVLASSARAFVEQLGSAGLMEFGYSRQEYDGFAAKMPASVVAQLRDTAAYRRAVPVDLVAALIWPFALATLAAIGWAWRRADLRDLARCGAFVVAGWLLNDAICGALSTPHERYQSRIVWALPLVAVAIVTAWWHARRTHRAVDRLPADVVAG